MINKFCFKISIKRCFFFNFFFQFLRLTFNFEITCGNRCLFIFRKVGSSLTGFAIPSGTWSSSSVIFSLRFSLLHNIFILLSFPSFKFFCLSLVSLECKFFATWQRLLSWLPAHLSHFPQFIKVQSTYWNSPFLAFRCFHFCTWFGPRKRHI